ncbi:hypothetical protein ACS0TY_003747 [Phlomoides rotata]
MSDRVVSPVNDANKKSKQTQQQHQSGWLAHWKRTSCKTAGETIGPNSSEYKELEYVTRNDNDLTEGLSKGQAALSAVSKQLRSAKRLLECEECYEDRHSADLVFERKMDCHSQPDNSVKACFKQSMLFQIGVETMRICATVDASEGIPEDCSRFSHTTNGLLFTKKTDVNAFKESDMVRNSTLVANTKGNISNHLFHCLSPLSGHGKQQVILQPLNSLTDSELKENIEDVKALKVVIRNESSAQTDTMNMDCSEENSKKNPHSAGSNSTASIKAFNLESNIPAWSNVASTREVLPRINTRLPALLGAATSSEGVRPSFSKTLETKKLVEQAKRKSNFANANPGDRWVKRLNQSPPNPSAQGTKSSNLAQVKISKLFGGIPKNSTTRSAAALEKSEEVITENAKEKGKEASVLSDAWIKRWLYIERESKCEPQSSKLSLLPSIAAMALMGKALAYLQPCEFQKRGSCTVWNIQAF